MSPSLTAEAAPAARSASARRVHARVSPALTSARAGSFGASPRVRRGADRIALRRAGEGPTDSGDEPSKPVVKSDPFGFGTSTGEPDKIQPGFDTAEGGKVGPVGTFFITVLLVFLFGASFFFTSIPRNAIEGFVDLSDDPNAPTQRF